MRNPLRRRRPEKTDPGQMLMAVVPSIDRQLAALVQMLKPTDRPTRERTSGTLRAYVTGFAYPTSWTHVLNGNDIRHALNVPAAGGHQLTLSITPDDPFAQITVDNDHLQFPILERGAWFEAPLGGHFRSETGTRIRVWLMIQECS